MMNLYLLYAVQNQLIYVVHTLHQVNVKGEHFLNNSDECGRVPLLPLSLN